MNQFLISIPGVRYNKTHDIITIDLEKYNEPKKTN